MTPTPTRKVIKVLVVSINNTRINGRLVLNQGRVKYLQVRIDAGVKLAPILVELVGTEYILLSGHHRLAAYKSLGWTEIEVELIGPFKDDSERRVFASTVNIINEQPLAPQDEDIRGTMRDLFRDGKTSTYIRESYANHIPSPVLTRLINDAQSAFKAEKLQKAVDDVRLTGMEIAAAARKHDVKFKTLDNEINSTPRIKDQVSDYSPKVTRALDSATTKVTDTLIQVLARISESHMDSDQGETIFQNAFAKGREYDVALKNLYERFHSQQRIYRT